MRTEWKNHTIRLHPGVARLEYLHKVTPGGLPKAETLAPGDQVSFSGLEERSEATKSARVLFKNGAAVEDIPERAGMIRVTQPDGTARELVGDVMPAQFPSNDPYVGIEFQVADKTTGETETWKQYLYSDGAVSLRMAPQEGIEKSISISAEGRAAASQDGLGLAWGGSAETRGDAVIAQWGSKDYFRTQAFVPAAPLSWLTADR